MTPFLDTADRNVELANQTFVQHDKPTLLRKIRDAGIVGAGGAGFPTYVKMQAEAEIYLVNAAECEPMLKVDQQLMAQTPDKLIRGLLYGMMMTNAKEGVIALKQKYQPAIDALTLYFPKTLEFIFCLTSILRVMKLLLSGWRQDAE
ncbi:hypothetical protein P7F88_03070 [Vibrio hannami]|uniref:hypothetical protein n=1 Tax=Vibrio hannami TaxID=2717094 RepID=UPI002410AE27|nr:hypothetical protein [Vibrio hannami]MDG3085134.1 hypothetical protein [Vibrio hannami]